MPKNIVICCDGTKNEYGDENTNVVLLYSMLTKNAEQVTYYDPGVGTMSTPTVKTKIGAWISKAKGLAFGAGVILNIEEAYRFLMDAYEDGDDVYIFGFSRGAYTARALAGLVAKCGLLDKGNENMIPYIMRIFRYEKRWHIHKGFRKTFSRQCNIHSLGLWDTVKSVGRVYNPLSLQYTANNPIVKNVRHAIAIDERRAFYRQNLWGKGRKGQSVKQVWFSGVHADVGGGYPKNETGPSLIALEWMLKQMPGLVIDQAKQKRVLSNMRPPISAPKLHDELEKFGWRMLEYLQ